VSDDAMPLEQPTGAWHPSKPCSVLCPECDALVMVKDVRALLLTLHQVNECDVTSALVRRGVGE